MRILVVEDEHELRESIAEGLRLSHYAVDTAEDGSTAEEMASINTYDLIVLDINLPAMNGFSVLKSIRETNQEVNVIFLTARTSVDDRVKGLDLGANDYVVKPFHFAELEARIRSLLRRKHVQEDVEMTMGALTYDVRGKEAQVQGERIPLTGKETAILEYLLIHRGRFVSQEELLDHVWDDAANSFSNAVRVHVHGLRKKLRQALGEDMIHNEIGKGYRIDEN